VLLLFLVLFYVYPLKFLFTHLLGGFVGMESLESISPPDVSVLMRVYGVGFAAVFGLFALLYLHAYKLGEKLELSPVERLVTRTSLQQNIALMLFGLVSFFVAFRHPGLAGSLYMGIGIVFSVHGSIMGKRVRLLADKIADETRKAVDTAEAPVEN